MAGCVGMLLLAGFTGCTKTEEASQQTQEESGAEEDSQKTPGGTGNETDSKETAGETGDEVDRQETQSEPGGKADSQKTSGGTSDEASSQEPTNAAEHMDEQSASFKLSPSEVTEHLGVKVQSVADEGMIFAQTTVMGE